MQTLQMSGIAGHYPFPSAPIPRMVRVRQSFPCPQVVDLDATLKEELTALGLPDNFGGASIAVAVGSRGILGLSRMVRAVVSFLRARKAEPFIVPAMGSHGQATAEGQAKVLESYGITSETMRVPVRSSMETVIIGKTESGLPVYCDANAWAADGIVLINRVKPHTQFRAPIESGLLKMMAIGLGKEKGATTIHGYGVDGLQRLIPAYADVFLRSGKVRFGLGVLENAYHKVARVSALRPEFMVEGEKSLLRQARDLLPRLPVEMLDLLILDRMGKDISGPGMDSNITGRIMANGEPDPRPPFIRLLAVLDLTEASHGNAVGLGLADLISERLLRKVDFKTTYINAIVGGFPVQGKTPMIMPDDRTLLDVAALLIGSTPIDKAKIIRVDSTLLLETIEVSESLLPELVDKTNLEIVSTPTPMAFDTQKNLIPLGVLCPKN